MCCEWHLKKKDIKTRQGKMIIDIDTSQVKTDQFIDEVKLSTKYYKKRHLLQTKFSHFIHGFHSVLVASGILIC